MIHLELRAKWFGTINARVIETRVSHCMHGLNLSSSITHLQTRRRKKCMKTVSSSGITHSYSEEVEVHELWPEFTNWYSIFRIFLANRKSYYFAGTTAPILMEF